MENRKIFFKIFLNLALLVLAYFLTIYIFYYVMTNYIHVPLKDTIRLLDFVIVLTLPLAVYGGYVGIRLKYYNDDRPYEKLTGMPSSVFFTRFLLFLIFIVIICILDLVVDFIFHLYYSEFIVHILGYEYIPMIGTAITVLSMIVSIVVFIFINKSFVGNHTQ